MLDLYEYDDNLCPVCGFHQDLHDPSNHFVPAVDYCTIAAGAERAHRELGEQDRIFTERNENTPPAVLARLKHPSDGRMLRLRLLSPLEVEARREEEQQPRHQRHSG